MPLSKLPIKLKKLRQASKNQSQEPRYRNQDIAKIGCAFAAYLV